MSDKDKIEVGDVVSIYFNADLDRFCLNATVLHVPRGSGDPWRIRAGGGQLVYVQQFETMVLERKGAGDE